MTLKSPAGQSALHPLDISRIHNMYDVWILNQILLDVQPAAPVSSLTSNHWTSESTLDPVFTRCSYSLLLMFYNDALFRQRLFSWLLMSLSFCCRQDVALCTYFFTLGESWYGILHFSRVAWIQKARQDFQVFHILSWVCYALLPSCDLSCSVFQIAYNCFLFKF